MIVPPLPYPMPLPWKMETVAAVLFLLFSNGEYIKKNMKVLCNRAENLGYSHGEKWKQRLAS